MIACMVATLALVLAIPRVSAEQNWNDPAVSAFVGSWEVKVTTPFFAYDTFATPGPGGTLILAGGFAGGDPLTVFSTSHGAWEHIRGREFIFTFRNILTGASGTISKGKGVAKITLDKKGDTFTGKLHVDTFAPDGTLLPAFSYDADVSGIRIKIGN
jgi:hypothetical protein